MRLSQWLRVQVTNAAGAWVDVVADTVSVSIERGAEVEGATDKPQVGIATIRLAGVAYDPVKNNLLRPRRKVRVGGGTTGFAPLFTGTIPVNGLAVVYPDRGRPDVTITAVDAVSLLSTTPQPNVYSGGFINRYDSTLAGSGVPAGDVSNINAAPLGITPGPNGGVMDVDDSATTLDQMVRLAATWRALAFAGTDGRFNVLPPAQVNPYDFNSTVPSVVFTDTKDYTVCPYEAVNTALRFFNDGSTLNREQRHGYTGAIPYVDNTVPTSDGSNIRPYWPLTHGGTAYPADPRGFALISVGSERHVLAANEDNGAPGYRTAAFSVDLRAWRDGITVRPLHQWIKPGTGPTQFVREQMGNPITLKRGEWVRLTAEDTLPLDQATVGVVAGFSITSALPAGAGRVMDVTKWLVNVQPEGISAAQRHSYFDASTINATLIAGYPQVTGVAFEHAGVSAKFGSQALVNSLTVRRVNRAEDDGAKVYGPYVNQASRDQWGIVGAEVETNDGDPFSLADYLLGIYADPTAFPDEVVVPIGQRPDLWPATVWRGFELYCLTRVKHTRAGVDGTYRLLSIRHEIEASRGVGKWTMRLRFRPREQPEDVTVTPPAAGANTGPADTIALAPGLCSSRRRGSVLAIVNNTFTSIPFDVAERTDGVPWDDTNRRWTIPRTGRWALNGAVNYVANSAGIRNIRIIVNGAVRAQNNGVAAPSGSTTVSIGRTMVLTAGDVVQLQTLQTSGGDLNISGGTAPVTYADLTYLGQ